VTPQRFGIDVLAHCERHSRARLGQLVYHDRCTEEGDARNAGRTDGGEFAWLWDVRGCREGDGEMSETGEALEGRDLVRVDEGEADEDAGIDLRKRTAAEDEVNAAERPVGPFDHATIVHRWRS